MVNGQCNHENNQDGPRRVGDIPVARLTNPAGPPHGGRVMGIHIDLGHGRRLTTRHAASSYGIPVYVVAGEAYGPDDLVPGAPPLAWLSAPARQDLLVACRNCAILTADERNTCERWGTQERLGARAF